MTDDDLNIGQRLTRAALQLTAARCELKAAEAALDEAKAKVADLEQKLIPDLMDEAGTAKWVGSNGLCITLNQKVRTNTGSPAPTSGCARSARPA